MRPFKNVMAYCVRPGYASSPSALAERLATRPLLPCAGLAPSSGGFIEPFPGSGPVAWAEQFRLIVWSVEEKDIPGSALKREVKKLADDMEKRMGFKPGRKVMRDLKERALAELLPKAPVKVRQTRAVFDTARNRLLIDTSSAKRAEELIQALRQLDDEGCPAVQTEGAENALDAMTRWLKLGMPPALFHIGSDAELVEQSAAKPTVRFVNHDLGGDDVRSHIEAGKKATRLGLQWFEHSLTVAKHPPQILKLKAWAEPEPIEEGEKTADGIFQGELLVNASRASDVFDNLLSGMGGPKAVEL